MKQRLAVLAWVCMWVAIVVPLAIISDPYRGP